MTVSRGAPELTVASLEGGATPIVWRRRAAFRTLAASWDDLLEASCDAAPFFSAGWFAIWCASFAPVDAVRLIALVDDSHATGAQCRLLAAAVLTAESRKRWGMPVRQEIWRSASNEHSPRFQLIARDDRLLLRLFRSILALPEWDELELRDLPMTQAELLHREAESLGFPAGIWPSLSSPFIRLPHTWAEFEAGLKPKFRSNLRRRATQLTRLGPVSLEAVCTRRQLAEALVDGFRLEADGWKGREATAIACAPRLRTFYSAVAHHAAARGWLALRFLKIGEQRVAFHFALDDGQRYFVLKPGYLASLAAHGLGHHLMAETVSEAIQHGRREVDLLGDSAPWKSEWTQGVRAHGWLHVYRPTPIGRATFKWKFGMKPRFRASLAWLVPGHRRGALP